MEETINYFRFKLNERDTLSVVSLVGSHQLIKIDYSLENYETHATTSGN